MPRHSATQQLSNRYSRTLHAPLQSARTVRRRKNRPWRGAREGRALRAERCAAASPAFDRPHRSDAFPALRATLQGASCACRSNRQACRCRCRGRLTASGGQSFVSVQECAALAAEGSNLFPFRVTVGGIAVTFRSRPTARAPKNHYWVGARRRPERRIPWSIACRLSQIACRGKNRRPAIGDLRQARQQKAPSACTEGARERADSVESTVSRTDLRRARTIRAPASTSKG